MVNNKAKQREIQEIIIPKILQDAWTERVVEVNRVTKVCKGGKKLSFKVIVIVGNYLGQVGVGIGKADDIVNSINKGIADAKRSLIHVPLTITGTIPHLTKGCYGACNVIIKPALPGFGIIAGSSIRIVLELSGIKNILAKQLGGRNILNNAQATINALKKLKTLKLIAIERNLPLEYFRNNNYKKGK